MKKVLFTVFALLFLICSKSYVSAENDMTDISAPEQTVARYFSECYDSFVKLECPDLSDVLDMSIVQCKNKLEVFKEVLDNWKWYIEEKKEPLIVEKLEYGLSFKDVVIEGDTATVTADLSCGEKGTAYWDDEGAHSYPHFMTFGINRFVLKNENGRWLIISHDNDSYGYDFDMSREEEYHYDKAELDRNREEVPQEISVLKTNEQNYLLSIGMPVEEVFSMDTDFRNYIFTSLLKDECKKISWEYFPVSSEDSDYVRSSQVLTGITYSAYAFKNGDIISIYSTYEFTSPKHPHGDDAFSYVLGAAFQPYEYGGALWSKASASDPWIPAPGVLVPNIHGLNFACYSGSQLGCSSCNMYFKGCTYCKALTGAGTDKRIVMSYLYNPNNTHFSLSLSYGSGITYLTTGIAYSSAQTIVLSY